MHFNILDRLGINAGREVEEEGVSFEDGVAVHRVSLSDGPPLACPSCGKPGAIHGHYSKEIRMTLNSACREVAVVRVPRFICQNPSCNGFGKTFSPRLSGIARGAQTPASVKSAAASAMASTASDVSSIAREHGMSPRSLVDAFGRIYASVRRGTLGEILCVDEFRFASHGESKFPVVLVDGTTGFLIDVAKSRQKTILSKYFSDIPEGERASVKYFASDMYDGFRYVKRGFFRKATHVVDLFHVVGVAKLAMSKERAKAFKKPDGLSSEEYEEEYRFLKSHWKLSVRREGKPPAKGSGVTEASMARDVEKMKGILSKREGLLDIYDALQALYGLVDGESKKTPAEELSWIRAKLYSSGLPEAAKAADTFAKWEREILAAFESGEPGARVTNAAAEGMNNRIATLSKNGFGLRSFERMRKRALLVFGKPKD